MLVKVLDPAPAGSTLAYSPVPAPLLELTRDGLALGLDFGVVDYGAIGLLAVFGEAGPAAQTIRMLLFLDDRRRPLLVDAAKIRWAQGLAAEANREIGGESDSSEVMVRRVGRYLLERNPKVALDRSTFDFLSGSQPRKLDRDVVALASSIGSALAKAGSAPASPLPGDQGPGDRGLGDTGRFP